MKKITIYTIMTLVFMSGCTQIVTAPIKLAGAAVGATIDVAGSAVGAVAGGSDD
jgi:uncharacterized protein YceK